LAANVLPVVTTGQLVNKPFDKPRRMAQVRVAAATMLAYLTCMTLACAATSEPKGGGSAKLETLLKNQ
jgi:hypothetical protein